LGCLAVEDFCSDSNPVFQSLPMVWCIPAKGMVYDYRQSLTEEPHRLACGSSRGLDKLIG